MKLRCAALNKPLAEERLSLAILDLCVIILFLANPPEDVLAKPLRLVGAVFMRL